MSAVFAEKSGRITWMYDGLEHDLGEPQPGRVIHVSVSGGKPKPLQIKGYGAKLSWPGGATKAWTPEGRPVKATVPMSQVLNTLAGILRARPYPSREAYEKWYGPAKAHYVHPDAAKRRAPLRKEETP